MRTDASEVKVLGDKLYNPTPLQQERDSDVLKNIICSCCCPLIRHFYIIRACYDAV